MRKKALITGVTGQDGAYLAELLLDKNYDVFGVARRSSLPNTSRIAHLLAKDGRPENGLVLKEGDLADSTGILRLVSEVRPHEVYNLAAQSHVAVSFESPEYTGQVNALGTLRLLDAIRALDLAGHTRFYQASTSELYGRTWESPQNEKTPFYPRSPYSVAKLYGFWITVNYREAWGIFGCNGILFNHESPRRGEEFVTRKITRAVGRIAYGLQNSVRLGNLNAKRDWGHARDYVEAMWLMLQHDRPDDYVVATGKNYPVRHFVDQAFREAGMELIWEGQGLQEKARLAKDFGPSAKAGQVVVEVDTHFFRPAEVDEIVGDASKAEKALGWKPKVDLEGLVREMVQNDLEEARRECLLAENGFRCQ